MKILFSLNIIFLLCISSPAQKNAKLLKSIIDQGLKSAKEESIHSHFSLNASNKDSAYSKSDTIIFTEDFYYFDSNRNGYETAHWTFYRNKIELGYYNGYFNSASSFDIYRYKLVDKNGTSTLTIKNNWGIKQRYHIYKIEKRITEKNSYNMITLIKLNN